MWHGEPLSSPTSSLAQPLSSPSCEETLCSPTCSRAVHAAEALCWASFEDGELVCWLLLLLLCSLLLSLLRACLPSSLLSSASCLP